ncbi:YDR476C [Zygosaccharomyces parabailii]|uniref:ZYBA0S03-10110g1_1 n=1 Tax=Zygosaccharomyces bailii (strain CLIB 213 / ATCC 58445 / CBS 680 / BCRC 21525 / NBRC 1098 / NCYC 1416 / NRRL Y-2227) TaxID=1333698 RepID=A0A8J2T647_ZYGB2|nr:YDR476C [Zygosaccharomyces parabailii]CDF89140.1 ZYBA0S03-10110g1_1 [Zygosaccharomyces bailii CLIB 213]CDH16227.1 uncharacterized protein ZBAI_08015 [Zygosaccharomyces bailii ISA1307]SJM88562.1 uncharacterized protein ZBIST_4751 [Zygosaccharomyces bailii]
MVVTRMPPELLAYMNKEHKVALEDFLHVYGGVSDSNKIIHVRLLSMDSQCMTILFNHKDIEYDIEKTIVFDPPLEGDRDKAWGRLRRMAREAAAKRHLAYFQINDMSYPSSLLEYLIIVGILLPIICYNFRQVLYWMPMPLSLRKFLDSDNILRAIIFLEFLIHLAEVTTILRPKLQFYRVPPDFLIEWYLFGLLEGYPVVKRFEKMAAREAAAVDAKS